MNIKIGVYDKKQFNKNGGLKKKAVSQLGFAWIDTQPYKLGEVEKWIKEVAEKLGQEYEAFRSPYFFTHIEAINKVTKEPVLIFEHCGTRDGWIITTPSRLFGNLTGDSRYDK